MTALEVARSQDAQLLDLDDAVGAVEMLVAAQQADQLDDARNKAEAYALYEKQRGNAKRERHYARLRLLAEAGLGVLSFGDPTVVGNASKRTAYRALAAAFERGKLLEVADACAQRERPLSTETVASESRARGYTYAPGKALGRREPLPWAKGRQELIDKGVDLASVPPATEYVKRKQRESEDASRRMRRMYLAADRMKQMQARRETTRLAKQAGPKTDAAYGLLRKTLQALHDAQSDFTRAERSNDLEMAFHYLYRAEEHIGSALRSPDREDDGSRKAAL